MNRNASTIGKYKYLPGLLRRVRWVQHFAAILAEALILIAFLASGMDTSLSGVMANNSIIKWAWAAIFSLGVDTSFVISWVRCRQIGRSWHLLWSIPMALGISFVVFEPVVVQLYQQALDVDFSHALNALGINLPVLVYARAGVAVALGAILALTNGEGNIDDEPVPDTTPVKHMPVRRQRFVWLKQLGRWLRLTFKRFYQWLRSIGQKQPQAGVPVTANQELPAQVALLQAPEEFLIAPVQAFAELTVAPEVATVEQIELPADIADMPTELLVAVGQVAAEQVTPSEQPPVVAEEAITERVAAPEQLTEAPTQPAEEPAQPEPPMYYTPEQRAQKVSEMDFTGLSAHERVAKVLELFPDLSDRELGKLSGMAPATAKKHRAMEEL